MTAPPPRDEEPETGATPKQRRTSMADGELRHPVELPTFLDGVAELMQLPPKASGEGRAAEPEAAAAPRRPASARQTALVSLLVVLVAGVLLARALQSPVTTLPAELQGRWHTDAPNYAGRGLEITTTSLGFQTGEEAAPTPMYPIVRVRRSTTSEGTLFQVEYLQNGDRAELDFLWQQAAPPEIRFVNQRGLVWTRSAPQDSAARPASPAGRRPE
jgi:hypothetical protein